MIELGNEVASVMVDVVNGARLASVRVLGHELLVEGAPESMNWGCYPMAPWAGRTRHGRFRFAGRQYRLPINFAPHAIHGTVYDRSWRQVDDGVFETALGESWPFPGLVRQSIHLSEDGLRLGLEVHGGPMPAVCGWHPWFRRRLGDSEVRIEFDSTAMFERGPDSIPTGRLVGRPPGPWDDCFEWDGRARLRWPGTLDLEIESDCRYLVVFDEKPHAVCVEPQTAPPDALNGGAALVEPGRPLVATTIWRWSGTAS